MQAKQWRVDVYIDEQDGRTHAEARLDNPDHTGLTGSGIAHRNPHDPEVPEIGDELAVARALIHLAEQLLDASREDIEQVSRSGARSGH